VCGLNHRFVEHVKRRPLAMSARITAAVVIGAAFFGSHLLDLNTTDSQAKNIVGEQQVAPKKAEVKDDRTDAQKRQDLAKCLERRKQELQSNKESGQKTHGSKASEKPREEAKQK
jgi:hypothetical protein